METLFSCSPSILIVGAFSAVILFPLVRWFISPVVHASRYAAGFNAKRESTYQDPITDTVKSFPSLIDTSSCYLTLVVPAYNEEDRLPIMLKETVAYLTERNRSDSKFTYEIVIVNDCSTDRTVQVVNEQIKLYGAKANIKLLSLEQNHGKGGAVRNGVMKASGEYILMVDADGATNIEDLAKLEKCIQGEFKNGIVVCGSRAHLQGEATAKRHPLRNILMHGFHFIVATLCVQNIQDTQCGFKLFDRKAAQLLFPPLHIERWGFDVELLYIAYKRQVETKEVAVRWQEIPGSKLDVVSASLSMLREMILIPFCYNIGIWNVKDGAFRFTQP